MQKQLPDFTELKKGALVLNALDHPLRQQILEFIHQKGAATVTEIYIAVRTEQTIVSKQLGILKEARFVTTKRQGKFIYYSVSLSRVERVNALLVSFVKSSPSNYIEEFTEYADAGLKNMKVTTLGNTFQSMEKGLESLGESILEYHKALEKKAEELYQEAKRNKYPYASLLMAEFTKITKLGVKTLLSRYKS